jgi:organic radical activating enzyme
MHYQMKIKVSELFYSIQGEGRYMGVPSVFLRTFGCNFTCDGFGMPPGEKSNERNSVATRVAEFKQYRDLPLVSTGCDSYASWDPRFKNLSPVIETTGLAQNVTDTLPFKEWRNEHLVITGGEPLLGWQRAFPALLSQPNMIGLEEITFETNGTQPLSPEFRQYLLNWSLNSKYHDSGQARGRDALTFSVSAKLSCSGEARADAICPDVVCGYEDVGYTYLKFVVATEQDADEALEVTDIYRRAGFKGPVYLMPVGGVESVYSFNNRRVAELAMKNGLRYSDRLQVPLFKNEWGT